MIILIAFGAAALLVHAEKGRVGIADADGLEFISFARPLVSYF